jgi:hypothetical protein
MSGIEFYQYVEFPTCYGENAMSATNLGPHSYMSPEEPHPHHDQWLSHFSPDERHALIEEDLTARSDTFGILVGALSFGLIMLLFVLLFVIR